MRYAPCKIAGKLIYTCYWIFWRRKFMWVVHIGFCCPRKYIKYPGIKIVLEALQNGEIPF